MMAIDKVQADTSTSNKEDDDETVPVAQLALLHAYLNKVATLNMGRREYNFLILSRAFCYCTTSALCSLLISKKASARLGLYNSLV